MLIPPDSACFHCHQSIPEHYDEHMEFEGQTRRFCCPGCRSVCEAISDSGLSDYYLYRSEPATKADTIPDELQKLHKIYDTPELQSDYVSENAQNMAEIQLSVEGIQCPACAWLIEKRLGNNEGIVNIGVDVSAKRATVKWDKEKLALSSLLDLLSELGYQALPFSPDSHEALFKSENKRYLKKLGLAGIMTMQVMMLAFGLYFDVFGQLDDNTKHFFHWISLVLTTPVVLYSASGFFSSALNGLAAKTLNMDLPISIAILLTYLHSANATITESGPVFFESICMFIFLLLIGRFFEHKGQQRAVLMSNNIVKQLPVMARLVDEKQQYREIPAKSVKQNQKLLIKAGEVIPVDGVIVEGESHTDESMLTGEVTPVHKVVGSAVYGGSINQSSSLLINTSDTLVNSTIYQILRLQNMALTEKPRFAKVADKLSGYFVAVVLLISVLTYAYWAQSSAPEQAIWITVTVLVATCPCALGLATPTAFSAAISKLNSLGLLLKRADILESLNKITTIAFDKTGTLTEGRPEIVKWRNFGDYPEQEIQSICHSLEALSEHPIAHAFDQGELLPVQDVNVVSGAGIQGIVDGKTYRIGRKQYALNEPTNVNNDENLDHYSVFLTRQDDDNRELLAAFVIADKLKEDVPNVVKQLKHFDSVILSGDKTAHIEQVAKEANIPNYFAELTPEQKLTKISELQQQNNLVLMLGDGINDAPVLAKADISLAVSGATDFAKRAADIVMLHDKMSQLLTLFSVAKKTLRIIKQNIGWALTYNIVVLPMAVSGMLTPWMAALGMSLSSLIVTYNSTRIFND